MQQGQKVNIVGRDEDASEPFIGLLLHAHAIRWAIENNLRTYDLCHGNEPYKYSLGAIDISGISQVADHALDRVLGQ